MERINVILTAAAFSCNSSFVENITHNNLGFVKSSITETCKQNKHNPSIHKHFVETHTHRFPFKCSHTFQHYSQAVCISLQNKVTKKCVCSIVPATTELKGREGVLINCKLCSL